MVRYVYHTQFDTLEHIQPGDIRHMGENVLALLNEIHDQYLSDPNVMNHLDTESEYVFMDIFGEFSI
jgi:hypothetical protein